MSALRDIVYWRTAGFCFYCAEPLHPEAFHLEHGLPRARGGSDIPWNLYASCPTCNFAKGRHSQGEFAQSHDRPFFGDLPDVRDYTEVANASAAPGERPEVDHLFRVWLMAAAYRQRTLTPSDDPNGWFFTTG